MLILSGVGGIHSEGGCIERFSFSFSFLFALFPFVSSALFFNIVSQHSFTKYNALFILFCSS